MEVIATQSVKRRLWKIINNTGLDYVLRDNGHKGGKAENLASWSGRRGSNSRPSAWEADALSLASEIVYFGLRQPFDRLQ